MISFKNEKEKEIWLEVLKNYKIKKSSGNVYLSGFGFAEQSVKYADDILSSFRLRCLEMEKEHGYR